jgi:hypothetical protein
VHCSHSLLSDIHHRRLLRLFALPYLAPRLEALADPLAHVATWGVAVALEIVLLALSLTIYVQAHADSAVDSIKRRAHTHMTDWENIEVTIDLLRIVLLLAFAGLYLIFVSWSHKNKETGSAGGII